MELSRLLNVFSDLVSGVVPGAIAEPMNTLAIEISNQVANLDSLLQRSEDDNSALSYQNDQLKTDLAAANTKQFIVPVSSTITDSSVPAEILRALVLDGAISSSHSIIRCRIQDFYRDCKEPNKKVRAIKLLRSITGLGLKDSKEQVEDWVGNFTA